MREDVKWRLLLAFSLLGLALAALAGLSEHVVWLASFCGSFSGGCKETIGFTLLKQPLWLWGVGYFALLVGLSLARRFKPAAICLVAGGIGVEMALVWVMISINALCIYCIGNLMVIVSLAVVTAERARFWQMLSIGLLFFMFSFYVIPRENELHASTAKGQETSDVVAVAAGEQITRTELETPLTSQILELQKQIYQLKRRRLEELIADIVLRKEAAERGIAPEALINAEVVSKPESNVSDQELEAYYEANKGRVVDWKGTPEELKGRMKASLQQQKSYTKTMEYAKSLGPKYGVVSYLEEPQLPRTKVNIEGSPSTGPENAPVIVVEFSDYECPACRGVHDTVKKVREMYAGRIRWVFKDFPLKMHRHAEPAALAGRCAAEQGKFWEYQDLLYGSKEEFTPDLFVQYAKNLGLSADQFKQCVDSKKYLGAIDKEKQDAKLSGIDRTPSFIINGKLLTGGASLERFKEMIDKELKFAETGD